MFGYHKNLLRQPRRELAHAREDDRKKEMQDWLARQRVGEEHPTCPARQAFSALHVNSAWMKVGAYPCTRQDVTPPQVRRGADSKTMGWNGLVRALALRLCVAVVKQRAC